MSERHGPCRDPLAPDLRAKVEKVFATPLADLTPRWVLRETALTDSRRQVLELARAGMSAAEIAERRGIEVASVNGMLRRIRAKGLSVDLARPTRRRRRKASAMPEPTTNRVAREHAEAVARASHGRGFP